MVRTDVVKYLWSHGRITHVFIDIDIYMYTISKFIAPIKFSLTVRVMNVLFVSKNRFYAILHGDFFPPNTYSPLTNLNVPIRLFNETVIYHTYIYT